MPSTGISSSGGLQQSTGQNTGEQLSHQHLSPEQLHQLRHEVGLRVSQAEERDARGRFAGLQSGSSGQ
jgi:hypothetical protein